MSDMDTAADRAHEELPEDLSTLTAAELVQWIKDNYRAAGYKRLVRPLLKRVA